MYEELLNEGEIHPEQIFPKNSYRKSCFNGSRDFETVYE